MVLTAGAAEVLGWADLRKTANRLRENHLENGTGRWSRENFSSLVRGWKGKEAKLREMKFAQPREPEALLRSMGGVPVPQELRHHAGEPLGGDREEEEGYGGVGAGQPLRERDFQAAREGG